MRITEEEKKDFLSKYSDDTSDELLTHLKRHYPVLENKVNWMETPLKSISIDGKIRPLMSNKKYLLDKIYIIVVRKWNSLGEQKIRRTIKKYLDGVMAQ